MSVGIVAALVLVAVIALRVRGMLGRQRLTAQVLPAAALL